VTIASEIDLKGPVGASLSVESGGHRHHHDHAGHHDHHHPHDHPHGHGHAPAGSTLRIHDYTNVGRMPENGRAVLLRPSLTRMGLAGRLAIAGVLVSALWMASLAVMA
jgi:hypothetical protein